MVKNLQLESDSELQLLFTAKVRFQNAVFDNGWCWQLHDMDDNRVIIIPKKYPYSLELAEKLLQVLTGLK